MASTGKPLMVPATRLLPDVEATVEATVEPVELEAVQPRAQSDRVSRTLAIPAEELIISISSARKDLMRLSKLISLLCR